MLSNWHWRVLEEAEEAASEVALEAADRFAAALAFLDSPLDVGDRWGVRPASGDENHVQRAVLTLDALVVKCREGGRTVNVCAVHAVGVNRDGYRESLGLDVVTSEDGAAWLAFLRSLVARGLSGVRLATSDAHPGLVDSIAATLPGASWQRCRTHSMRNLLTRVPKATQSFVATMVRTIFAQADADTVRDRGAYKLGAIGPDMSFFLFDRGGELEVLNIAFDDCRS